MYFFSLFNYLTFLFPVMMKIALFGNRNFQPNGGQIVGLLVWLKDTFNAEFVIEPGFKSFLGNVSEDFAASSDDVAGEVSGSKLALSFGGDGALMRAAKWVVGTNVPIMGINTGHLGYLTSSTLDGAKENLTQFFAGHWRPDVRSLLQVKWDGLETPLVALNEIAILRQDTSSMLNMKAMINDAPLTTYQGDGLVICTPSGSTAYNLSAGGPIMAPATPSIGITPISPHSLTMRPLVIPDSESISVVTHSRAEQYQVSVDGNTWLRPNGTLIVVSKATETLTLVQPQNHNFANTLRNKLLWGTPRK